MHIVPLRQVLEEIDRNIASNDLTEITIAAAESAKVAEYGWRTGHIVLVGRLRASDELEVIKPPNSLKPALDRFGGRGADTPVVRIARRGRHELWRDIHLGVDGGGLAWLRRVCRVRIGKGLTAGAKLSTEDKREAEAECTAFLIDLMKNGPPAKNRAHYRADCIEMFGVSARGFERAWSAAIAAAGDAAVLWTKGGPKIHVKARGAEG